MQLSCKMCGGNLIFTETDSVCECEYCGSRQTIPKIDDEKKGKLYARANRLRLNNEFDKASGVYESIVAEFQNEAEAYWGLVLCKYGIEYVDDPLTAKKVPTCHRSSYSSLLDDADYKMAIEHSSSEAKELYISEGNQIEEIRKGIIEVSNKEQPYDVFICYKETASDGGRTVDSVMAQDVYEDLTEKGYRVFFSRITLEDKLGVEYEPYIFAALNSAKVMLVFGTEYEYFDAVWVKNEWSRYLKLMSKDRNKYLIPCYKGMDAYDLPKEFSKLQAQDMGKVGAKQDLIRGIEKIIQKKENQPVEYGRGMVSIDTALKRAQALLDLGNYNDAEKAYTNISQDFPSDYRGWWGLIICEIYNPKKTEKNNEKIHDWYGYTMKLADDSVKPSLKETIADYLKNNTVSIARRKVSRVDDNRYYKAINNQVRIIDQRLREIDNELYGVGSERSTVITKGNYLESRIKSWEAYRRNWVKSKKKWHFSMLIFLSLLIIGFIYGTNAGAKSGEFISLYVIAATIFVGALLLYPYEIYKINAGIKTNDADVDITRAEFAKTERIINDYSEKMAYLNNCKAGLLQLMNQNQMILNDIRVYKQQKLTDLGKYYIHAEASEFNITLPDECPQPIKELCMRVDNVLKKGSGLQIVS